MGTWNTKPFGNDTARDWLWKLEKAEDDSVLNATLQAALDAMAEPESPLCEEAIAAAAVIEATRREPIGKLPAEAKQWVSERGFAPPDSLVQLAIKALERISARSELRALWEESRSAAKWQKELELLLAGLRYGVSCPPRTRALKPQSGLRSRKVAPAREDPQEAARLQARVTEKLNEIASLLRKQRRKRGS